MKNDELGNRIKEYENVERRYLMRKVPTIIRLDGKSFHCFTRGFHKPFDMILMKSMWDTAKYLCKNVIGCKVAYTQSDEITLLLTDYDNKGTQSWFSKNVQKMCSVSASMATLAFNNAFRENIANVDANEIADYIDTYYKRIGTAMFDSRVFNIPKDEVCNVFIWRQQDATRNAVQMVGRANFPHKKLQEVGCNEIQEMLFQEKGINFNDFPAYQKRGVCIVKESYIAEIDKNIPLMAFCKSIKDKKILDTQTQMSFVGMIKGGNIEPVLNYFEKNNLKEKYEQFAEKLKQKNGENIQRVRWVVDENIPIFTKDRNYIEKYI